MQPEQLGPYKIGRKLGRGGMGTVYAGIEPDGNKPAAIKVLSAAMAQEEGFRERFEAEIESLRKLNHPNIVRLFGFGEQDGLLFYAMELVEGRSLEEELQAGRTFDWREATDLSIQCCRALQHAHYRGVIHRDIKPANLLLAPDGTLKLSDFGIAKLFGANGLTADGGVLGTAEYMAPEQADGRPVTDRCDLYSLGGVMYALLARRPPFRASSLVEMLQLQRFAEPEPLRRFAPDAPAELESIIGLLLEKDPDRRIPTAMVLSRRLEAMRHGLSVRADESGPGEKPAPSDAEFIVTAPTAVAVDLMPPGVRVPTADEYSLADGVLGPTIDANRAMRADLNVTSAMATSVPSAGAESADAPPAPPPIARKFVTVEEEERRRREEQVEEAQPWVSPQALLLVASLAAMGFGVWYFLQPPTQDDLYGRVVEAARQEDPDKLSAVEGDIQRFLSQSDPNDPRADELQRYRDDIELNRLERKIEQRQKGRRREQSLTAIERAYIEALNYAQLDPELGVRKLEAIVNLYGGKSQGDSPTTRQCLELARRKLDRLRQEVKGSVQESLDLVNRQMADAEKNQSTDPASAAAIWKAVIELYADKPWAKRAVERARQALSAAPAVAEPLPESSQNSPAESASASP